ncbi:uncharacterized protein B0H64DRAFT_80635 [Chaetomium fimeti]|uniref:Uncharacterized protein n=1 Tax=Chaetomium fimeti TaxID=1854472 RepID=A0AAE0HLH0_9PEZI|nr:hypothetical protein B0H64DRAFT_80635 [Chaetomium fimeti]
MNGSQHANDTLAQRSPQGASTPAAAPANGNSAINKKRKKDGLKPIITTEGPGSGAWVWRIPPSSKGGKRACRYFGLVCLWLK